jgi:predicted dehydrogenase
MAVRAPMRIGLVGCGVISDVYLKNAPRFRDMVFTAASDINPDAAMKQAGRYAIEARSVKDLLASDDVDIVLNLTIPEAHAEVSLAALDAGKHVYSEKPLAATVADGVAVVAAAKARGLRIGAAPDTVLGAGVQQARALIDGGAIGRPLSGLAAVMSHGMEHWHPNPGFFFRAGAGPVFDMGPYYLSALVTLLGPVASVQAAGKIGFAERIVTTPESPVRGQSIRVETLTDVHALLLFASGAHVTFMASWDVWKHGLPPIELHGELASLRLPDPNWFGGDLLIAGKDQDWRTIRTDDKTFGAKTGRRPRRSSRTTAGSAWPTWRGQLSMGGPTGQTAKSLCISSPSWRGFSRRLTQAGGFRFRPLAYGPLPCSKRRPKRC